MVGYIQESTGGDFKPTPEGQHVMVCCRIIDIGTQKTEFNGETKHQRKVVIFWEIPGERTESNMPLMHSEKFTWSFHEKANLRKVLESWRGRKFKDEDFSGPPNGFHIKNVLGVPCYGQIIHEQATNGKTYANLSSIMSFPGKRDDWPKVEGGEMFFDLDAPDMDIFDGLSDYWKGVIKNSPEWSDMMAGLPDAGATRGDMDSEIPF